MAVTLVGIDGAGPGWIVALRESDERTTRIAGIPANGLPGFLGALPKGSVIAIDIPMGLGGRTEAGGRACERACRVFLGPPRQSSVFSTPSRDVVFAADWDAACAAVRRDLPERKGVSRQSWNIFPKIREADEALRSVKHVVIRESHPEAVFATMNGGKAVIAGKQTAEGHRQRLALLEAHGLSVAAHMYRRPSGCKKDDLVDAFACLWAAGRIAANKARVFGETDMLAGHMTGIWV